MSYYNFNNNATNYITWTTNTSTTGSSNFETIVNYYTPYVTTNQIYSTEFQIYFTDDMDGLASYMFTESSSKWILYILEDIQKQYDSMQDFEDDLYKILLDILYDISKETDYFPSFLEYSFEKLNRYIQNIINEFNAKHLVEEI